MMVTSERSFYTLKQLVAESFKSEDEILDMVSRCELWASCWFDGMALCPGLGKIPPFLRLAMQDGDMVCARDEDWFDAPSFPFKGWVWALGQNIGLLRYKDKTSLSDLHAAIDHDASNRWNKEVAPSLFKEMGLIDSKEDFKFFESKQLPMFYKAAMATREGKQQWTAVDFEISRGDLVFLDFEVARINQGNPRLLSLEDPGESLTKNTLPADSKKNKGGKPKSTLREAVEHIVSSLEETGEEIIMEAGNIELFWAKMRQTIKESTPNFLPYVFERISIMYSTEGKTHALLIKEGQQTETTAKSINFKKDDVSKILSEIRKNNRKKM